MEMAQVRLMKRYHRFCIRQVVFQHIETNRAMEAPDNKQPLSTTAAFGDLRAEASPTGGGLARGTQPGLAGPVTGYIGWQLLCWGWSFQTSTGKEVLRPLLDWA